MPMHALEQNIPESKEKVFTELAQFNKIFPSIQTAFEPLTTLGLHEKSTK